MAGRVLAVDVGRVRMGLAISDESGTVARGLEVYARRSPEEDVAHLREVVAREGVARVVLGHPVRMDGTPGPQAREAQKLRDRLEEALGLPVELFDERLTTQEAERVLLQADLSREKRKRVRDQQAAVLILQGYLNRRRREARR